MSFQVPAAAMVPSSPAECRSGKVFTAMLLLVLLAVTFPEMAPQALQGILWSGAGLLVMLLPPEVRVPRVWLWLAAGFVGFSLVGFLPREWFHVSPWRLDLEALGLDTGASSFVQRGLAIETLAGFAVTTVVAVYLLGHRVASREHQQIALGFVLGVTVWTLAALCWRSTDIPFGFFPNRNHTATLLIMGTFAGLGCCTQAIRLKDPWGIVLSAVPTFLFLGVLLAVSESRAGVMLLSVGLVMWILLSGWRYLQGHARKAVLLLLVALGGMFLIGDFRATTRLRTTVKQLESPLSDAVPSTISFAEKSTVQTDPHMDGRIAIYHDTWTMIRHENWSGVGPGQFARVYPQYWSLTSANVNSRCAHPESDWLWMLAENGWSATLCLVAVAAAVLVTAVKQVRSGRTRFLRTGSLVAAILLCLHGVFDVPGHRVGLAWAAALLAAMSLRTYAEKNSAQAQCPSRVSLLVWRSLGVAMVCAGVTLLAAQCLDMPILPSAQALRHMEKTKELYDADQAAYDRAMAKGLVYQPPAGHDPLESALEQIDQALRITPLDPHLHYFQGALALHFDDKSGVATRAFAIQRRLDPYRVDFLLDQARAWMIQDPDQTVALWREALRRAAADGTRFPTIQTHLDSVPITYQEVLQTAGKDETFSAAALELADGNPVLLVFWARSAPMVLLDRAMPRLLPGLAGAEERVSLFKAWKDRGGQKGEAAGFAQDHPELELSP